MTMRKGAPRQTNFEVAAIVSHSNIYRILELKPGLTALLGGVLHPVEILTYMVCLSCREGTAEASDRVVVVVLEGTYIAHSNQQQLTFTPMIGIFRVSPWQEADLCKQLQSVTSRCQRPSCRLYQSSYRVYGAW